MIKSVALALWVCAVVVAVAFGTVRSGFAPFGNAGDAGHNRKEEKFESIKTRQISIPIMVGGKVEGYVVVRLAAVAAASAKALSVRIEDVLTNEAFIAFQKFSVDVLKNEQAPDLRKVTDGIAEMARTKLPPDTIHSVLIHEIAFVDKKDARK